MPKYTFECPKCKNVFREYVDKEIKTMECDKCGQESNRKLPVIGGADVYETVNDYTNTKVKQDHKELLKERNEEFYWKVEVPRLAADPKYSLETKLDNGWVWVDDSGKIHVHTKPPHRR